MLKFVKQHIELIVSILFMIFVLIISKQPSSYISFIIFVLVCSYFKLIRTSLLILIICIFSLISWLLNFTIPVNINIIPYFSCQANYTMFDDKVIIDKIVFFNKKIYIAPFAIPLDKGKIKRFYLSTPNGYISIKDLNIYNVKNSDINIEIKNINLHELLNDNKYKDLYINGKVLVKLDGNKVNGKIQDLTINNFKFNDINIDNLYINGTLTSTDIHKNINCDVTTLTAKNIKIKDNRLGDIHLVGSFKSSDIKRDIDCTIQDLTARNITVKDNSLGDIHLVGSFKSNDIKKDIGCNISDLTINKMKLNHINIGDLKFNGLYKNNKIDCTLHLPNLKHNLSCNGTILLINHPNIDVLLKSNTPLVLNNLKIQDNIVFSTNCQYNIQLKHNNNNNIINLDLKTTNNKIKNINLGNITLQGKYNNDKLQCKLNLNKWKHTLNCNGNISFNDKFNYNLNINSSNPLLLHNINISKDLLININSTYKLNVQNTNKDLDLNGNIKLYNGTLFKKGNIQYLKDIQTNININKSTLNIDKFNATIPSFVHGKLILNGKIDLNPNNKFTTNCNLKLINGVITNLPVLKGTVNANLNLNGSITDNPSLKGDIVISNAKANLTPVLSGALLSTQIIEKFIKKKPKSNTNKIILSPINTDINVKIDKVLEANGPGLETTWKGNANIKCNRGSAINWDAKLSLLKGKYMIANKKLKLTSGECIANPNIPGLFTLTLAGRKKSNNDIVEIKFIQKQNNTQIEFFSQPMKSKQDVLALLLFDKYNSELTSSEAYSLGITIQSLASGKGSIFSKINDTLRIDSIELKDNTDNSGEEYKSISIGKKIGKWKVNLERGKENDSTKISAERRIAKNFKANVGLSKDSGLGASLMWSKRY